MISERSKVSEGHIRGYRCLKGGRCQASSENVPLWLRCVLACLIVLKGRKIFDVPKYQVRMKMQLVKPQLARFEILVIF